MTNGYCYWEKTQYYPICNSCNQKYNPQTRWCSKECWIRQRDNYKKQTNIYDEFVNIFDDIIIEKKEEFIYKNECHILQIEPLLEKTKIKKSYHKLVLKYHPDKGGSNDKFIELQNAYNTLINVC